MSWSRSHVHAWMVHTEVRLTIEDTIYCAWLCRCGEWKWRTSPENLTMLFQ